MRVTIICLTALMSMAAMSGCGTTPEVSTEFRQIDSDQIYSVRYFADTGVLAVLMQNGEGYDYRNVPQEAYRELLRAADKDDFFNQRIKGQYESSPWDL